MGATANFVIGCWVVVVAFWIVSAFSVKRVRQQSPLRARLFCLLLAVLAVLLLNASFRVFHVNHSLLRRTVGTGLVADALVALGTIIALWARVTLGRNWSARVVLKHEHELIQSGPYRVVRHPIYAGILLMILGTAVLGGQVGGFIALLFCFGGFWVKLRREEALLGKHLPGYTAYMARTKALVPFIL